MNPQHTRATGLHGLAVHIGNISPAISRSKVQWPLAAVAVLLAGIVIGWRFW